MNRMKTNFIFLDSNLDNKQIIQQHYHTDGFFGSFCLLLFFYLEFQHFCSSKLAIENFRRRIILGKTYFFIKLRKNSWRKMMPNIKMHCKEYFMLNIIKRQLYRIVFAFIYLFAVFTTTQSNEEELGLDWNRSSSSLNCLKFRKLLFIETKMKKVLKIY